MRLHRWLALLVVASCGGQAPAPASPEPSEVTSTPPAAEPGPGTRIMVSVVGRETSSTFLIDVDAPEQVEPFGPGTIVLGRAPAGDAYVALRVQDGRPNVREGFVVLDRAATERAAFASACTPLLLDADRLVLCEETEGDPGQTRIVAVEIGTGARTVLGESEGSAWDDIPLSLTPDGRAVVFHLRRAESRGLVTVPLAGGPITDLMPDGFYVEFHADRGEAFVLTRPEGGDRTLHRYDYVGGALSNPRPVPPSDALLAIPYDRERALVWARGPNSTWLLHALEVESGDTTPLDPSAAVGDATALGAFVRVAGDRIAYLGAGDDGAQLRVVPVDGEEPPTTLHTDAYRDAILVGPAP